LSRVRGDVVFQEVGFAYEAEPVLKNFSLHARPGEVIALVGPSGAGKSTIAGLLTRFYDPQQGAILIDGQDIRQVTLASLKRNLALVDQETFLFNTTIAENIRYGVREAGDDAVLEAARQAFADEFIRQLPEGYQTAIGDRGLRLSGGQRQRLCIARAILRDAPILILDEATSALDTESEAMVQKALANLMRNRTTFVIAHRLSTIMHADKIVVLEDGRIVQVGSHQELLQQGGLYQKLYEMQFQDQR
jgi:subfamily B ATP-binding cassette protein MsbA